ncbi:MAG: hypothetical protein E7516_08485 [Ruminococcaceae bacterium]|nr:hypothetical protein [Oscillospiraceae bacterium]
MSSNTLRELGVEYEKAAEQIKEIIDKKRKKLRGLKNSVCSNEAYELKSELHKLYAQHRETQEIAEYLKSYYEPSSRTRQIFDY